MSTTSSRYATYVIPLISRSSCQAIVLLFAVLTVCAMSAVGSSMATCSRFHKFTDDPMTQPPLQHTYEPTVHARLVVI